jgi:hypothetical protein
MKRGREWPRFSFSMLPIRLRIGVPARQSTGLIDTLLPVRPS